MEPLPLTPEQYLRRILLAPVYDVAERTPLNLCQGLSSRLGVEVHVKREDLQSVHSFKLRGAYAKMRSLKPADLALGVVTASAGNHAQGVALSGQKLGVRAVVVMPVTTPSIKVAAVRRWGAEVVLHGDQFDAAQSEARRMAREEGLCWVPPFDDPWVIAGQGTIGAELMQQHAGLQRIYLPIGGGGLAAGVALYVKQLRPDIRIIGVEPEDAASMKAAWEAGGPVELPAVGRFADGVAVRRVGDETYRLCRAFVDELITVSTDQICAAIKDLFDDLRIIAEPAGALALAGLKQQAAELELHGQCLSTVLTGANINFHTLRHVSERTELSEGKEAVFAVTIPEAAGSYLAFCELLGDRSVTEFNYRISSGNIAHIFVGVRLGRRSERSELLHELDQAGYQSSDLTDDELAKLHVRHMVGGRPPLPLRERVFSFEFPEAPGALLRFLRGIGSQWSISLFHYRNHGAAYGRVLAGFVVPECEDGAFLERLSTIGYRCWEETGNPAYAAFLAPASTASPVP